MHLRDVEPADLDVFYEDQRDAEGAAMAAFTPRARDAFFAHWRDNVLGNPAARTRTIVVDGAVAGNVVSWSQGEQRLVGYWISRAFWGRGVATAALRAFLAYDTTRPMHAYVAAHNAGSIRVLERCGFVRVSAPGHAAHDGVVEHVYRLDA